MPKKNKSCKKKKIGKIQNKIKKKKLQTHAKDLSDEKKREIIKISFFFTLDPHRRKKSRRRVDNWW